MTLLGGGLRIIREAEQSKSAYQNFLRQSPPSAESGIDIF